MLSECTIRNIIAYTEKLDSCWSEIRGIVYDKSRVQVHTSKAKKVLSWRERSVRECIRGIQGVAKDLESQEASMPTSYIQERLSRGIENLSLSLDRLQAFLLQDENRIRPESVKRIEELMAAFESYIEEIECNSESLSDEIEACHFDALKGDLFGYEPADEDSYYGD